MADKKTYIKRKEKSPGGGDFYLHLAIALIAFTLRLIASLNVHFNDFESASVLHLVGNPHYTLGSMSIIEELLTKATFFLFGPSETGARIWPVITGAAIPFVPFYLQDKISRRQGFLISILLAIDPFLAVNSIQIGGNIFSVLGLLLLLSALWKRDQITALAGFFLLVLSGRGLLPASISVILLVFMDSIYSLGLIPGKEFFSGNIKGAVEKNHALLAIVFSLFIIAAWQLDLSTMLISWPSFFSSEANTNANSIRIAQMLVSLFSYSPFVFAAILISLINKKLKGLHRISPFLFLIFGECLFLFIAPEKQNLDLVWVVLPVLILAAAFIDNFVGIQEIKKRELIVLVFLLVLCVSFFLALTQFVYRGNAGLNQADSLISISTIAFFILLGFLTFLYFGSWKGFIYLFSLSTMILLLFIQTSFTLRAVGLGRDASYEVTWSAANIDRETLQDIIERAVTSKKFANNRVEVCIQNGLSPQISWVLREEHVSYFLGSSTGSIECEFVITQDNIMDFARSFYGHSLRVKAQPTWFEQPIKNLISYDYWSWLNFRNSSLTISENTIWYAIE